MKNIDVKSLLIGALLTSTIFFGMGQGSPARSLVWDEDQRWIIMAADQPNEESNELSQPEKIKAAEDAGETEKVKAMRSLAASYAEEVKLWNKASVGQPFAVQGKRVLFRKRIK